MGTTTIGVDLGVTAASDVAVAEGVTVTASRKVASTPEALTAMFAKLGADGPVNVVVESTAMAWFVAAVAVARSGIDARVFRVSGTKAAALRKFYPLLLVTAATGRVTRQPHRPAAVPCQAVVRPGAGR